MAVNAVKSHPDSPQSDCDLTASESTPPQQTHQPLTPPSSDERRPREDEAKVQGALDAVNSQTGLQSLIEIKVAPTTYARVLKIIDREVRRHDYDPDREKLVIRMPSPTHEVFSRSLAKHLQDQLDRIASREDDAGRFASNIISGGTARILLQEGTSGRGEPSRPLRRQPDEQFLHKKATYPGVVIEVSYSQDGRDLRRLAQDYILYSNGDIKLVIGIDINDDKACTVSSWRPRYTPVVNDVDVLQVVQEMERQAFRSPNRKAVNVEDRLEIHLSDFATDEIFCGDKSANVYIEFSQLARFLGRAEEVQEAREPREGQQGIKSSRQTRKRPLSSSSAEELVSGDEARFLDLERQTAHRAEANDCDFTMLGAKRRL